MMVPVISFLTAIALLRALLADRCRLTDINGQIKHQLGPAELMHQIPGPQGYSGDTIRDIHPRK